MEKGSTHRQRAGADSGEMARRRLALLASSAGEAATMAFFLSAWRRGAAVDEQQAFGELSFRGAGLPP